MKFKILLGYEFCKHFFLFWFTSMKANLTLNLTRPDVQLQSCTTLRRDCLVVKHVFQVDSGDFDCWCEARDRVRYLLRNRIFHFHLVVPHQTFLLFPSSVCEPHALDLDCRALKLEKKRIQNFFFCIFYFFSIFFFFETIKN